MKWFKHYTNAHKGTVLQDIYAEFGVNEGYGLYFRMVEYFADKWDGCSEPRFVVLTSELRSYLRLRQQKLLRYLLLITYQSDFTFKENGKKLEIFFPKLLEIRHRDACNASTRLEISQHQNGVEEEEEQNRTEREEEKPFVLLPEQFVKRVPIMTMEIWRKRYGENLLPWIEEALGYFATLPAARSWSTRTWVGKVGNALTRKKMFDEQDKKQMRVVSDADMICGIAEDPK